MREKLLTNVDVNAKAIADITYEELINFNSPYAGWHDFPTKDEYVEREYKTKYDDLSEMADNPNAFKHEYYKLREEEKEFVLIVFTSKEKHYSSSIKINSVGEVVSVNIGSYQNVEEVLKTIPEVSFSKVNMIEKINYDRNILPVIQSTINKSFEEYKTIDINGNDSKDKTR